MSAERWREELKVQERIVTKRVWKGNSSYTLEDHAATHRNANSVMDHAGDEGVVFLTHPNKGEELKGCWTPLSARMLNYWQPLPM